MNKIKYIAMIVLVMICTLIVGYNETHYNRYGYISNINNNEITIEDTTDNQWIWINDDNTNYGINQSVVLKMNTNGTDTIYDDSIIKIK